MNLLIVKIDRDRLFGDILDGTCRKQAVIKAKPAGVGAKKDHTPIHEQL